MNPSYPTDMTDEQWELLLPLLPNLDYSRRGKRRIRKSSVRDKKLEKISRVGFHQNYPTHEKPMSQYSELKQVLQAQLNWQGARISFLALFLLALLKVKTVNLSELCLGFGGRAMPQSSYKRSQRFFREFDLDYTQLASVVVNWMQIPGDWVLSLDRTPWKFGTHGYNILTLGIVHEGVAFPVLGWMLDKRGNSHSDERMRCMETFAQQFPTARVNSLGAEREFIGQGWVRYLLLEPALAFRLRIRRSDPIEHDGKVLAARVVFAHLLPGQSQRLTGTYRVWGYPVAVEALQLEDGELLVVIAPNQGTGFGQRLCPALGE
jgi:hypothetical protein